MDYVSSADYEKPETLGICAGVSHFMKDENSHEFKLHFDDQESVEENNIPSQMRPGSDRFQSSIMREAYYLYTREGYGMFQNWLANAVLRINTGKPDAKIIIMTAPMRSEK